MTDGLSGPSLAGANVLLHGVDGLTRQAVTDASGRFEQSDLPPGRYLIAANKGGYTSATYGAAARGKPGVPVALAAGQMVGPIDLSLHKGAVFAGRLLDPRGSPVVGVSVTAVERLPFESTVRYVRAGAAVSDDRGGFRIYGLPASSYLLAAVRSETRIEASPAPPDWMRLPLNVAPRQGRLAPQGPRGAARYRPTFYPGTSDPTRAQWIAVGDGDEKVDVNLTLQATPTAEMVGRLTSTRGAIPPNVRVTVTAPADSIYVALGDQRVRSVPASGGHFTVDGLNAGSYAVVARTEPVRQPASPGNVMPRIPGVQVCAVATAIVGDEGFVGLNTMALNPGATLAGHVTIRKGEGAPDPGVVSALGLRVVSEGRDVSFEVPPARVGPDGAFEITDLPSGSYSLDLLSQNASGRPDGWRVTSATAAGQDVLASPLWVNPGSEVRDVVVTVARTSTEISGTVLDKNDRPTFAPYVFVFSADPSRWTPGSRWVVPPVRPATDGTYRIVGLIPGDYEIAVLDDYDPAVWSNPRTLQEIAKAAIRVKLSEGEKRVQSLRMTR